jgi:hypothetical protein
MKCRHCNSERVPEEATFCPSCGESLIGEKRPSTQIKGSVEVNSQHGGKVSGVSIETIREAEIREAEIKEAVVTLSPENEDALIEKVFENINDQLGIPRSEHFKAKPESRLHYKIRIYPLALWQDKQSQDRVISLFLRQNSIQSVFQLELGHCDQPESVESQIANNSGSDVGEFIEALEQLIQKSETDQSAEPGDVARIVVTNSYLPRNYIQLGHPWMPCYWCNPPRDTWGVFQPNRFFVVSLATFWQLHSDIPVEDFLLRQIQRLCMRVVIPVSDKNKIKRMTHVETRGCLFDFVPHHNDARYFTNLAFICKDCERDILEANEIPLEDRQEFLDQFQHWLNATLPDDDEDHGRISSKKGTGR